MDLTAHSKIRLKQRAHAKKEKDKKEFAHEVEKFGYTLDQIPRIPKFKDLIYLMESKINKHKEFKHEQIKVYIYKSYLVLVSKDNAIITILYLKDRFKYLFDLIAEERVMGLLYNY